MLPILSLFVLALAVSLDGMGVGIMYGLRKIRIPFLSIAIICLCSGIIIFGSMQIGSALLNFLSPSAAKWLGASILIGIGLWAIIQIMIQKNEEQAPLPISRPRLSEDAQIFSKKTVVQIELRRLGLVIQILRTPSAADVDRSGSISASEATLLGIALSLDAFGAGIGAALIGLAPLLTASIIALSSGLFIALGMRLGHVFAEVRWIHRMSVLPGCILILMGIIKLL
jgi:putative sporulation protein YtaF